MTEKKDNPDLRILIIDDDITQLTLMRALFESYSTPECELDCVENPLQGLELVKQNPYDLVITDFSMNEMNGKEVFERVHENHPQIPVVIMTAVNDIEMAISLMRDGVYDFIVKPVKNDIIYRLILKVLDHCQLEREINKLKQTMRNNFSIDSIIGTSKAIRNVIDTIGRCAEHTVSIMIRGESGTGKELVARALHFNSPHADGPFVVVNIAALSESLIESELFGHVKGAFTGAERDRQGRFDEAHGGTLFIDEVGDIPLGVQVKLLRVIQFMQFSRIGENRVRTSNVRILTATSRNLESMMEQGSFRSDLYYRLNVVEIQVPPLRERKEDIPLLVNHFYKKLREEKAFPEKTFSREAMHLLMSYDFPGNVRELQNIVEHASVFSRNNQISSRDLPPVVQQSNRMISLEMNELDYDGQMLRFESSLLQSALEEAEGNQSEAARELGISERRLRYRLEKLGLK